MMLRTFHGSITNVQACRYGDPPPRRPQLNRMMFRAHFGEIADAVGEWNDAVERRRRAPHAARLGMSLRRNLWRAR